MNFWFWHTQWKCFSQGPFFLSLTVRAVKLSCLVVKLWREDLSLFLLQVLTVWRTRVLQTCRLCGKVAGSLQVNPLHPGQKQEMYIQLPPKPPMLAVTILCSVSGRLNRTSGSQGWEYVSWDAVWLSPWQTVLHICVSPFLWGRGTLWTHRSDIRHSEKHNMKNMKNPVKPLHRAYFRVYHVALKFLWLKYVTQSLSSSEILWSYDLILALI